MYKLIIIASSSNLEQKGFIIEVKQIDSLSSLFSLVSKNHIHHLIVAFANQIKTKTVSTLSLYSLTFYLENTLLMIFMQSKE